MARAIEPHGETFVLFLTTAERNQLMLLLNQVRSPFDGLDDVRDVLGCFEDEDDE